MRGLELSKHQEEGVSWIMSRIDRGKGFILGDEMGMGKTIQILKVLERLYKRGNKSLCVVVPLTLLNSWTEEIDKFGVEIDWVRVRDRKEVPEAIEMVCKSGALVIATYEVISRSIALIKQVWFDLVLFDEGHRIKNRETLLSKRCKEIRSEVKGVISGTPVQNNLLELWNLVDAVSPGYLGDPHRFREEVELPIKRSKIKRVGREERVRGERIEEDLKERIGEVLLVRRKSQVELDIPKKKEILLYSPLSRRQRRLYEETLREEATLRAVKGEESPLRLIHRLRSICNHPALLNKEQPAESDPAAIVRDSGKFRVLEALLREWKKKGRSALIFSQSRRILRWIDLSMDRSIKRYRMDGETPLEERASMVRSFNGSKQMEVLLLTTKVGGVGLNLERASRVLLFDMDWNPFNDEQAKGRAHRIGQKSRVRVYRLLCPGTIEEAILTNQELKKALSDGITSSKRRRLLDKIDLCRLFHFSYDGRRANTADVVEEW
jgi:DNA excision repair protein ERCC-6